MRPVKKHIHIYTYMPLTLRYIGLIGAGMLAIGLFLLHVRPAGQAEGPERLLLVALYHLDAVAWLHSGILVLIATPIIGLFTAMIAAIFDADWRLLGICVLLFLLLWITVLVR